MTEIAKTRLKAKGRIRIIVSALIFCGFGIVFLLWGWDGWIAGQIVAHPKGRPSFVAKASGPHEFAYYVEVFGLLFMGAIFFCHGYRQPFVYGVRFAQATRSSAFAGRNTRPSNW